LTPRTVAFFGEIAVEVRWVAEKRENRLAAIVAEFERGRADGTETKAAKS
jgi:hypothetical protein